MRKTLEDFDQENDKSWIVWIGREKEGKDKKKFLKKKMKNTCWGILFIFLSFRILINRVPIEQGKELLKISFKFLISCKLASIDRNMNKSYSIDLKPIEPTWEQWLKIKEFSICKHIRSIKNFGNLNFWKTTEDYSKTTQPK